MEDLTAHSPDHDISGHLEEGVWHLECDCGWSDDVSDGTENAVVNAHIGEYYPDEPYDTHEEKRGK